VLVAKGMVAFLAVAATLAPLPPPRPSPATPAGPVCGLEREIVTVWARMVLAHAP
jgi:hypothetical protein